MIYMTEEMSAACILYVEPPGGESHNRSYQFPTMLIVRRSGILTVALCTGSPINHIDYLPIADADYVVVSTGIVSLIT